MNKLNKINAKTFLKQNWNFIFYTFMYFLYAFLILKDWYGNNFDKTDVVWHIIFFIPYITIVSLITMLFIKDKTKSIIFVFIASFLAPIHYMLFENGGIINYVTLQGSNYDFLSELLGSSVLFWTTFVPLFIVLSIKLLVVYLINKRKSSRLS